MQVAIFRRNVDSQADEKVTGGGSVFQNQLFNSVTYHAQLRQDAQADTDTLTDIKPENAPNSWHISARQHCGFKMNEWWQNQGLPCVD